MAKREQEYVPSPDGMSDREIIKQLYVRILGDGSTDNPGMSQRLSQVEEFVVWVKWGFTAIGGTAATLFIGWVYSKMTGKQP